MTETTQTAPPERKGLKSMRVQLLIATPVYVAIVTASIALGYGTAWLMPAVTGIGTIVIGVLAVAQIRENRKLRRELKQQEEKGELI